MLSKCFLPKLSALALAIAVANANAATCTPTNVLYAKGSNIQVPCIEVHQQLVNATFKLVATEPEHIWELQKFTPADSDKSGVRAKFSLENNRLKIPLLQSTDGRLWRPELEVIESSLAEAKPRFKLKNVDMLDPAKDVSRLVIKVGNPNTTRRANDKTEICDNGKTKTLPEPAVQAHLDKGATLGACGTNFDAANTEESSDSATASENTATSSPAGISAAVLKVKRVEITGTNSGTMNLDISGDLDLLKVIQDESQLLGEIVLPADTHIGQVRLILDSGSYVTDNGTKYALTVPSGEQTGLKIIGDWTTVGGQVTALQLGLSLADIRFNKGRNEYRMKPTVKISGITNIDLPTEENGKVELPISKTPFILTVGDQESGLTFELPEGAYLNTEKLYGEIVADSLLSSIYELSPDRTNFNQNGTITINYNESNLPDVYSENDITILRDGISLTSLVNTEDNTVTAQTEHFSCYVAVPIHSCNFTDIDDTNIKQEWMNSSIKKLCNDAVIQGYPLTDGTWKYEPNKNATLLEILKVISSTTRNSCTRYMGDDISDELISNVENKLNLQNKNLNEPVTRKLAIEYLANLHFGYFEADATERMQSIGLTNGERLADNITRAELAHLADKSRSLLSLPIYNTNNPLEAKVDYFIADNKIVISTTNADISKLRDGNLPYFIPDSINVQDILLNDTSIWKDILHQIDEGNAKVSKDNKSRYFLSINKGELTQKLETGIIKFIFKTGDTVELTLLSGKTLRRGSPKVEIEGYVRHCIDNPDFDADAWFFTGDISMWEELEGANVEATIKNITKSDKTKADGWYRLVWSKNTVCDTTEVKVTHPTTGKYLTVTADDYSCSILNWHAYDWVDRISFYNGHQFDGKPDCGANAY